MGTVRKMPQHEAAASVAALYKEHFGTAPDSLSMIAGAGSNRMYFRACTQGKRSVIATFGTDPAENRSFIYLARHFASLGLPVPDILAVSADDMAYLQSDLGDTSLFSAIAQSRQSGNFSGEDAGLLRDSLAMLARVQFIGFRGIDFNRCFPSPAMDDDMILSDLNYFKYCFLKTSGTEFDENRLASEFDRLHAVLAKRAATARQFMVRDFQSRNVMLADGVPFLIDFQGGRRGPVEYDVASFLWQAKANIPAGLRKELVDYYISFVKASFGDEFDENEFRDCLPYFVLFRMLQTLGAYGFRGLTERKPHFISSIPSAVRNLASWLKDSGLERVFPYITSLVSDLEGSTLVSQISALNSVPELEGRLTVTVSSFSYKKGVPIDLSGNGGGFAFDCRAIHNPGRYDEYKPLTGRDVPVIQFIESNNEAADFLSAAAQMVDASVRRYSERGFTSLSVAFGCTGGRHRSVYCAEHMAHHIAEMFPEVRVVLWHREQDILEIFNGISAKSDCSHE